MRRYFTSRKMIFFTIIITALSGITILSYAQNQPVLAQKLMLENTIRMRITDALQTLLEDSKFVVDVKVDLEFEPLQKQETVYRPSYKTTPPEYPEVSAEEPTTTPTKETQPEKKPAEEPVSLPGFEMLPGIPTYTTSQAEEKKGAEQPEQKQEKGKQPVSTSAKTPEVISHSVEKATISIPKIKRMEINLILDQGISTAVIENIRRVVEVAAQYDRNRGDVINIMSSAFSKKEKQESLDAIFLKNIAEKIDKIEKRQQEQEKQKALQERLSTERAAAKRDSQRIAMLTDEIGKLKMQIMAGDLNQQEKEKKQTEAMQREQELQMVKAQLEESNRRLMELEKGLIEEGKRQVSYPDNTTVYLIAGGVIIAILLLFLIIWLSQRARAQRPEAQWSPGYQQAPPQMMPSVQPTPTPPVQEQKPPEAPPSTKPKISKPKPPPVENQQEVKGLRQSVISLSVGQPDTASRIVKEWLSEQQTESESSEEEGA